VTPASAIAARVINIGLQQIIDLPIDLPDARKDRVRGRWKFLQDSYRRSGAPCRGCQQLSVMPYKFRIEWSCLAYIFHNNSLDHSIRQSDSRRGQGLVSGLGKFAGTACKKTRRENATRAMGAPTICFAGQQGRGCDYLDCAAADTARLCRWCGFAQVPSDREQFVTVVSEVVDGPWFFSAALVGPIANLNVASFPESEANASCGMTIAMTPIPTSRSTRRPMMSKTDPLQKRLCRNVQCSLFSMRHEASVGAHR
jgi:hypothetical protein